MDEKPEARRDRRARIAVVEVVVRRPTHGVGEDEHERSATRNDVGTPLRTPRLAEPAEIAAKPAHSLTDTIRPFRPFRRRVLARCPVEDEARYVQARSNGDF